MTAINIGLHIKEQVIDLRVPSDVTIRQLCEIITAGLATQVIYLPAEFRLHVLNKPIRLDDDIYVREYPLANGDRLMVVTDDVV